MSDNLFIWDQVKSVPSEIKSKIIGGRLKGKTDIKPQWRLMVLTEQFGPCGFGWRYETVKRWTETVESQGEVSAHVCINLFINYEGLWSEAIEGQGGSMLIAKEKSGLYHSDEAYKMATTDAISVACKQIGIGSDVYMGYSDSKNANKKPQAPQGDPVQVWQTTWLTRINALTIEDDGHRAKLTKMVQDAATSSDHGQALLAMNAIKAAS